MTPTTPLSRAQVAQASAIATVAYPVFSLLGRTWSWHVDGYEHYEAVKHSGRVPIFAFWHGRILSATIFWRQRGIVVMTSENFDGEWIARIIRRFGYDTARGSSSRGGRQALVQLRRDMREGKPAAFTVDGPRGPARSVQPGAVWLASLTACPILPFHIEASRHWSVRSWDQTQIPKPFSRVTVAIGEPLECSLQATETMLEVRRKQLEESLSLLEVRASEMLKEAT